ncbi:hypothetical protein BC828DRAFT_401906 [Blastocladiella britannica]|nr:hypothetical protein BC828DRAFT_401906 [Blastocladiella britannica]
MSYDDLFGGNSGGGAGRGAPPTAPPPPALSSSTTAAPPPPPRPRKTTTNAAPPPQQLTGQPTVARVIAGKRKVVVVKKIVLTPTVFAPTLSLFVNWYADAWTANPTIALAEAVASGHSDAPGGRRKAPSGTQARKRGGMGTDLAAYYREPYDPTTPTDFASYRAWRAEVRKSRPPPPATAAPAPAPKPAAGSVRASRSASPSTSSSSSSSTSDNGQDDTAAELDEGTPMPDIDVTQLPAFLSMYLTTPSEALANRLAVTVPSRHLAPTTPPRLTRSRILALDNVVDPEDVDSELRGEIVDECSKYGRVEDCVVHIEKPHPNHGTVAAAAGSVRIFVRFKVPRFAKLAATKLHGRYFSKRMVVAGLYDEVLFGQGRLGH